VALVLHDFNDSRSNYHTSSGWKFLGRAVPHRGKTGGDHRVVLPDEQDLRREERKEKVFSNRETRRKGN